MRRKNRKPIASIENLPQFTTMNVIEGQAGLVKYSSLIFYSLTLDNILNIIVLLIFAGVTIAALSGSNGILTNATKAKEDNTKAQVIDEAIVDILAKQTEKMGESPTAEELEQILTPKYGTLSNEENILDRTLTTQDGYKIPVRDIWNGTLSGASTGGIQVGEKAEEDTTINGEEGAYNNPTIPKGFKAVDTETAKWNDSNGWENGLVIEDATNDPVTQGSQFVWVPVQNYSNFHLIEGYSANTLQTRLNQAKEAGSNKDGTKPGLPNAQNTTKGTIESIAMYKSVSDYGGFYIARYEAGISRTAESTEDNTADKQIQDGSVKPVSKQGVVVWNWIAWGGTSADTSPNDGLSGDDTKDGAVKVARSMYNNVYTGNNNTETDIKSTLCYGVQWDAVMNFIDSNYVNGKAEGYVANSENKGNYTGNVAKAGDKEEYSVNNIYDMAGNVWEWTMEGYTARYNRGGHSISGYLFTASCARYSDPDLCSNDLGFRIALYL